MAKKNTPLSVAQRNLLPPVILRSPDVLSAVMDAATNLDVVEFQSNPWGQAWALIRSGDVQDLKKKKTKKAWEIGWDPQMCLLRKKKMPH